MSWFVYLMRCADDTLYCGMTDDTEKRLKVHNSGKGAKYTPENHDVAFVIFEMATFVAVDIHNWFHHLFSIASNAAQTVA